MDKLLIDEYNNLLLGNQNQISTQVFSSNKAKGEKIALEICRYVIENILKWTPEEASKRFNREVVDRMKLHSIIKYVEFPVELDDEKDYFYIVYRLYPTQIHFDSRNVIVNVYRKILASVAGPVEKGDSEELIALKKVLEKDYFYANAKSEEDFLTKLPKKYLSGNEGIMRLSVFLQYALEQFIMPLGGYKNIAEIYDLFSNVKKAENLLKMYKLYQPYYDMFDQPLDYLHLALPKTQKNNAAYFYLKWINENKKEEEYEFFYDELDAMLRILHWLKRNKYDLEDDLDTLLNDLNSKTIAKEIIEKNKAKKIYDSLNKKSKISEKDFILTAVPQYNYD